MFQPTKGNQITDERDQIFDSRIPLPEFDNGTTPRSQLLQVTPNMLRKFSSPMDYCLLGNASQFAATNMPNSTFLQCNTPNNALFIGNSPNANIQLCNANTDFSAAYNYSTFASNLMSINSQSVNNDRANPSWKTNQIPHN